MTPSHGSSATYFISFNVIESVAISKILGNGALATSCRASDDEDVVMIGDGHCGSLGRV